MRMTILTAIFGLLAAAASRADFVDNFNAEGGGRGQLNYESFANWTVANSGNAGGTVDLIGNGYFDLYPGNGLYVDLLGSSFNGPPGLLTTRQTFAAGSYTLSFDLAGSARNTDNHVQVNLGSFSQTLFMLSGQGYTRYTYAINLTSAARLSFQNVEYGTLGAILDNVSVITVNGSAVPEPASPILVGMGLASIGFLARFRKREATAIVPVA